VAGKRPMKDSHRPAASILHRGEKHAAADGAATVGAMSRSWKAVVAALAVVLALALAACGDDEEGGGGGAYGGAGTTAATDMATTETAPAETGTTTTGAETGGGAADGGGAAAPGGEAPEDQEGGAGDEVPASSQALITGEGGKLSPGVVRVPPFIAIRVVLRSADGVEYELSGGGKTVKAGGEIESASKTFEGLRTGERLVLRGPQGNVAIEANAEPGP
jgi:hypothetical protein